MKKLLFIFTSLSLFLMAVSFEGVLNSIEVDKVEHKLAAKDPEEDPDNYGMFSLRDETINLAAVGPGEDPDNYGMFSLREYIL